MRDRGKHLEDNNASHSLRRFQQDGIDGGELAYKLYDSGVIILVQEGILSIP
jgi:hypothetical protein